ncbi:MAG: hypothetical protein ABIJ23_02135 [Candidatus Magasanikbacteria bacterium]
MDTHRSTAHLQREIGDELFDALVSSDNTERVRQFAKTLVADAIPIEMTIGGRTYDLLGFLKGNEKSVKGDTMVIRAKEMNANLGKEEGEHLLKHQDEIPVALRGKIVFVFTDWRLPGVPVRVAYVYWDDDGWVQGWHWLGLDWYGLVRVLRRK